MQVLILVSLQVWHYEFIILSLVHDGQSSWLVYERVSYGAREKADHTLGQLTRIVKECDVVRFFYGKNLRQAHLEELVTLDNLICTVTTKPISIAVSKRDWKRNFGVSKAILFG